MELAKDELLKSFDKLLDDLVEYNTRKVRQEEVNIRKLHHACMSAYTEDPINVALVAMKSEGKTWLATNVASLYPDKDILILRSVSAKTFTREVGEAAVFNEETERYETTIKNEATGEDTSVNDYLEYLKMQVRSDIEVDKKKKKLLEKALKDSKTKEEDRRKAGAELAALKEEEEIAAKDRKDARFKYDELKKRIVNLVDMRHRILVFLEEPSKEVWANLLSVLSHDAYYNVTKFVEGEGVKRVKTVVFEGFPAVIYCTSKTATTFGWGDLNTRFEVLEPNQSPLKYKEAIELSTRKLIDIDVDDKEDLDDLRGRLYAFISEVLFNNYKALAPFEITSLTSLVSKPESGSLMRTWQYFVKHLALEALWHYPVRPRLTLKNNTRVLIGREDLEHISNLYLNTLDLLAELNGLPTTALEFYVNVLLKVKERKDREEVTDSYIVRSDEARQALEAYILGNPKTSLKTHKMAVKRYVDVLKAAHMLDTDKDEEDKRAQVYILKVGFEDLLKFNGSGSTNGHTNGNILASLANPDQLRTRIFKLVTPTTKIEFYDDKKLVTYLSGVKYTKFLSEFNVLTIEPPYDAYIGDIVLCQAGYIEMPVTTSVTNSVTNSDTKLLLPQLPNSLPNIEAKNSPNISPATSVTNFIPTEKGHSVDDVTNLNNLDNSHHTSSAAGSSSHLPSGSSEAPAGSGVHLPADGVGVAHAPTPPTSKSKSRRVNPELIQGRVQSFISRLPISGVIAGPKWNDWSYLINSNFADLPQEEVVREFKKALDLGDLVTVPRPDELFAVAPATRQVNTDPEYDDIE